MSSSSSSSECWAIVPYTGGGGGDGGNGYRDSDADRWAIVPYAFDAEPISVAGPLILVDSAEKRKRGRPRANPYRRPAWLPPDWTFKRQARTTGKSIGHIDTFFYNPGPKRLQFRSRSDVMYFLDYGKKRPPRPRNQIPAPAAGAGENGGQQ